MNGRPARVRVHEPAAAAPGTVDYAFLRRRLLEDHRRGRVGRDDVCDADPYLLRAAHHHGEPSTTPCPLCAGGPAAEPLTRVTYVFGEGLGESSGRACASRDFAALADAYGELTAYVVEVCRHCRWNHLVSATTYGEPRPVVTRHRRPRG